MSTNTSIKVPLLDLRAQYDERVQDFTQDQKIEALIDEQLRDDQADGTEPAAEPVIDPATGLPIVTDPAETDPTAAEPAIDPATGLPVVTDPTDPTDPTATDPTTPDPTATDPTATDPTATTNVFLRPDVFCTNSCIIRCK